MPAAAAAGRSEVWALSLELLQASQVQGLRKDARQGSKAITAFGHSHQWKDAMLTLQELESSDIEPNVVLFGSLTNALKGGSGWQLAFEVLERSAHEGLQSLFAHNAAMSACRATWVAGLALLASMTSVRWSDAVTYNTAITVCTNGKQAQRATRLLNNIKDDGLVPDQVSFASVILACKMAADWQAAVALWQEMEEQPHLRPDSMTHGVVMAACCSGQQWERALRMLESICQNHDPDLVTVNTALSACSLGRCWLLTLTLLERLQRSTQPDVISLNAALTTCERADSWQAAVALMQTLSQFLQPDGVSYASCTSACGAGAGSQRWGLGLHLLTAAAQRGLLRQEATSSALKALQEAEFGFQRWARALLLFNQAILAKLQPDSLFLTAALGACRDGAFEGSMRAGEQARSLLARLGQDADIAALGVALDTSEAAADHAGSVGLLAEISGEELRLLHELQVSTVYRAVIGIDLLQHCSTLIQACFHRVVVAPVLPRLQELAHSELEHGECFCPRLRARRDPLLERQPMLGASASAKALLVLGMHQENQTWSSIARCSTRSCTSASLVRASLDAIATALSAWLAFSIHPKAAIAPSRGRISATMPGGPNIISPIAAHHDRAPHGERQALLTLAAAISTAQHTPGQNLGDAKCGLTVFQSPFALVDEDGSGRIEKSELEVLLSFLGLDPDGGQVDSLFDVLDTDKDGLISFQEFVDFVFRTGDRDFLTESEFMKVRELQAAHKEAQKAPVPGEDVRDAQAAQEEQLPVKDATEAKIPSTAQAKSPSAAQEEELVRLRRRTEELEEGLRQREKVIERLTGKLQKAREEARGIGRHSRGDSKASKASSSKSSSPRQPQGDVDESPDVLKREISQLKKQLHEKQYSVQRLENQQEKIISGYTDFVHALLQSSASEQLQKHCNLKTAEMLGKGAYGFVMKCQDKEHQEVVVKLQGPRWASVAAQEWANGSACSHENIVAHLQVLMHYDGRAELEGKIMQAFETGTFTGKQPKLLPDRYICMLMEHMNRGTVQHLSKEDLINLEGLAAVIRQVASALAFMHKGKRTHNDVKPENILLKQLPDSPHLIVKLADFGLAQCSVERDRDLELSAYTFWCLGLRETFEHMPAKAERPGAVERFKQEALPQDSQARLRKAIGEVIADLWTCSTSMQCVATMEELKDAELSLQQESHQPVAANADREVSHRMERQAVLWKAVDMVTIARKWSEEVDYQGWL
ncbi:unnamed protein product [Effrenium voratum]|nr:unnamed protein product [Effrenium voratum]